MIALIAFANVDKPKLDDSICSFVANALHFLDLEGLNHFFDFISVNGLLADVAVAILGVREEAWSDSCRHAARCAATVFDIEVTRCVLDKWFS